MSELSEKLMSKKESIYRTASSDQIARIFAYAEGYKHFLDVAKTEREAVVEAIAMAEKCGKKNA